jgi:hypothetical protein
MFTKLPISLFSSEYWGKYLITQVKGKHFIGMGRNALKESGNLSLLPNNVHD